MGEHLEPVVACNADESKAYRLCSAYRQSRRRRDSDYDGRSNHAGFLHKLDRNTARQHNDAQRSRLASMQQSARQLVERIVPPDVFTEDQLPTRLAKCCTTIPSETLTTASSAISAGSVIMPSVYVKPKAKSSRSSGLAIKTAWPTPS